MILIFILLTVTGLSIADNVCETKECNQTANLLVLSVDQSVDPCEDFYKYSCGSWIKNHPITDFNRNTGVSHFQELQTSMLTNLLTGLTKSTVATEPKYLHPLLNFFKGCENTNIRDLNGKRDMDLIRGLIKRVGGWPMAEEDWKEDEYDIENALIEFNTIYPAKAMISIQVMSDLKNNSKPIIAITNPIAQAGYEGIYRFPKHPERHDIFEKLPNLYDLGAENPIQVVAEAVKGSAVSETVFTTDMTNAQRLDRELNTIATPIDNFNYVIQNYDSFKISFKDLDQYPGIDFKKVVKGIMKSQGIEVLDNDVVLADKEYLKHVGTYLKQSKRSVATIIGMNLGLIYSKFTTSSLFQTATNLPKSVMPQVCMSFAAQMLPDLLGRYFMDKLFSKEAAEDMKVFITSLKEAFNELLEENQWMDTTTKKLAINKLKAISEHIAFPAYSLNDTLLLQYIKKYENFSENTFMSTMITSLREMRAENLRALKDPEDKGHWPAPANAVMINAFYNPEVNGIFFPAGIAQFPFYQHTRPEPLNLGAIGMVISHELTHAFDNMGSLFDEKGNLHQWFTSHSTEVFTQKAQCFVEQYSKFKYDLGNEQTIHLNGLRTLGENIADNGGIRIAYRALEIYKKKNVGKELRLPGTLTNYSDEKLFFMSYANIWCSNQSPQLIENQIAADPHSIPDARVIATLANFPEFAKTYNCKAGTAMNPTNKCVLWG